MEFKTISKSNLTEIKRCLDGNDTRICEYTFGVVYMWDGLEKRRYCIEDGTLYLATFENGTAVFNYPMGGDERAALIKIKNYCISNGYNLKIIFIGERDKAAVEEMFDAEINTDRDWDDYIYDAEEIINLSGKKYHGQKNHFNRFTKEYPDYKYVEYSDEYKEIALKFYDRYYGETEKNSEIFFEEKKAFLRVINNFSESCQKGGILMAGGEAVALSFGEVVGDTLYVHFEKALRNYAGSYAVINRLFAEKNRGGARYVNREEDVGDEGLRTAKTALHPVMMVKKYFAKVRL